MPLVETRRKRVSAPAWFTRKLDELKEIICACRARSGFPEFVHPVHNRERLMNTTWKPRLVATAALAAVTLGAQAQQEIKIGVIYPLTGPLASSGAEMRDALEFAADVVNNGLKGVPELPFSAGGGLPALKGAKIKLVFADHQGNPQVGATEAERLISQEHVVAL